MEINKVILTKVFQDFWVLSPVILNMKDVEIAALSAPNRQALINAINTFKDSSLFKGQTDIPYLHVELSGECLGCKGCSADYKTEADVPEHSVPCSCGNPKHWLIKYTEDAENKQCWGSKEDPEKK